MPSKKRSPAHSITFAQQRDATAADCDALIGILSTVAEQVRAGDLGAFERMFMAGGTEEGDAKIHELRERLILRYVHREDARDG